MVHKEQFDELVASTTRYLQDLMNRVIALEAKIAELESKKGAKKND